MTCPMNHAPMSRGERRRLEREIEKSKRQPGVGLGWRFTTSGRRKYPVLELAGPVDQPVALDRLIAEPDAAATRLGWTWATRMEASRC